MSNEYVCIFQLKQFQKTNKTSKPKDSTNQNSKSGKDHNKIKKDIILTEQNTIDTHVSETAVVNSTSDSNCGIEKPIVVDQAVENQEGVNLSSVEGASNTVELPAGATQPSSVQV